MYQPATAESISELVLWVRLQLAERIGANTARRLLTRFGLPDKILSADLADLTQELGARRARALKGSPSAATQHCLERTRAWLELAGNYIITLADARFPQALLQIPDPPILLYAKGRVALLQAPSMAVVGSRNATTQGVSNAEALSAAIGAAGITICSGLALGIDAAAHRGGLRNGAASTIAVIGTGIDIIYPARNRELAHRIAVEGCIVSEYPLGTPAIASNFPRRNRLISGLSQAVLVVEAAAQSGSLITARVAAEQGRDVFAIPGSIHSPLSKGCHQLIKEGAKLVETAQDVLDELAGGLGVTRVAQRSAPSDVALVTLCPSQAALLTALGFDPVDGDALATRTGTDPATLNVDLLALEMAGLLEQLPGGLYQRLHVVEIK